MSIVESVLRAVGGAASTAISHINSWIIPEAPLWRQFTRIGGGLGPQQVTEILREADLGKPSRLVDLVHECRQKDGHLQAVLGIRELAIAGLDWSIAADEDADDVEKQAAQVCEAAIRDVKNFPVVLAHLAGEGNLFPTGSWAELVWGIDRFGEFAGVERPWAIRPISSRRFGFRSSDGRLVFVEAGRSPESDGVDLLEEYGPGNFLSWLPRVNGDVQVREGLARVIAWDAVLRNWGVRDWLEVGESSWKPRTLVKYLKSADKEDRDLADTMIQVMTGSTAVSYPESLDVKYEWPKSTGSNLQSVHRELCEFFGQEISKAVIGQTLTTEAGSRGARSLGDVHNLVRQDIREADALGIAAAVEESILKPFYQFNYPGFRVPSFRFHTEDGVDLKTLAEVVDLLAGAGVKIPQAWVRDKTGIREPNEDDELCQPGSLDANGEQSAADKQAA